MLGGSASFVARVTDVRSILIRLHAAPSVATLNLVAYVDDPGYRDWVLERAAQVAGKHPSRLIVLDATRNDGTVSVISSAGRSSGTTVSTQRIDLAIGDIEPDLVASVVRDTMIGGAHGVLWWSSDDMSCAMLEALVPLVSTIAVDSSGAQRNEEALRRTVAFVEAHPEAVLCDLAYMRLAPWREMIAQFFDDPALYDDLFSLRRLEVAAGSDAETLYLAGWLGSRLSWSVRDRETFVAHDGTPIIFVRTKEGNRRRVARVVLDSADSRYVAALSDDDRVVRLSVEGAKAKAPWYTPLQSIDNMSLLERATLDGCDRIFETTLETVHSLL